jgi:uncharacterized iron-regulated membrane protein
MLAAAVALLTIALVVTGVLLWRAYRKLRVLECILADADDRVRTLELRLRRTGSFIT